MNRRYFFIGMFCLITLLVGGFTIFIKSAPGDQAKGPGSISSTALYAVQFHDLDGKKVSLAQWQGKVLLINFWAEWCAPCREEIPYFVEAQRQHAAKNVQIIGIAIDAPEKVRPFSREMKINYPIFLDEESGLALSRRLGNRAGVLPFTAVIDQQGRLISTVIGPITHQQIEERLQKLL